MLKIEGRRCLKTIALENVRPGGKIPAGKSHWVEVSRQYSKIIELPDEKYTGVQVPRVKDAVTTREAASHWVFKLNELGAGINTAIVAEFPVHKSKATFTVPRLDAPGKRKNDDVGTQTPAHARLLNSPGTGVLLRRKLAFVQVLSL